MSDSRTIPPLRYALGVMVILAPGGAWRIDYIGACAA